MPFRLPELAGTQVDGAVRRTEQKRVSIPYFGNDGYRTIGLCELLDTTGKGDLTDLLQLGRVRVFGEFAPQLATELERQGGLVLLPVCASPFEPCSRVVAVAQPIFKTAGEYPGDAVLGDGAVVDLLRLANDG